MRNLRFAMWLGILFVVFLFFLSMFLPQPSKILKSGRRDFDRGQYQLAQEKFKKVIGLSKKSSGIRCEAQIFYATCFVRKNDLVQGARQLREFIKLYPTSFWTPQAYFDLAYCESALGKRKEVEQIYIMIIDDFSTTSWAKYAKERLNEFKE